MAYIEPPKFREPPKYSLDLVEAFVDSIIAVLDSFGDSPQHDVHTRTLLYVLYKEWRTGRGGVPAQYLSAVIGVSQTSVIRRLRRLEEKFGWVHRKKAGRFYLYYLSRPEYPTLDDSFLGFMAKIIDRFEPFVRNHHEQLLTKKGEQVGGQTMANRSAALPDRLNEQRGATEELRGEKSGNAEGFLGERQRRA